MQRRMSAVFVDAAVLLILALVYFMLLSPASVAAGAGSPAYPVYKGNDEGSVSLVIELSWDAAALDAILDTLDRSETRVTFAVSGEWALEFPEKLNSIASRGHEIATLGFSPDKDGSFDEVKEDIGASLDAIASVTGERPRSYFCGSRERGVSAAAGNALGLVTFAGTCDLDCGRGSALDIVQRSRSAVSSGSVIIAQPTESFSSALPFLLEKIKNLGMAIVPAYKMWYN